MGNNDLRGQFLARMGAIAHAHRPSRAGFFSRLAQLPGAIASSSELLGDIHLIYQSAMHATRVAVYHLPYLDAPALRTRKLQIFLDDDDLPDGDTHHYQLTRVFANVGAALRLPDQGFGPIDELCRKSEPRLSDFMQRVKQLYPNSHGAWCVVEMLSVDWMTALVDALAVHFPAVRREAYFAECFDNRVEERHAAEALSIAADTIAARPWLFERTVTDARAMAGALDDLWQLLDDTISRFHPEAEAVAS